MFLCVGVMVGSMAYGHLADQFGRKRCIDSCYLGYIPLAIALAYVPYYWLFLVLRFFIGFFIQVNSEVDIGSGC